MRILRFTRRLVALVLAFASLGAADAAAPPNILYIVSDDHGYNDLGCFGSAHAAKLSPRLDRVASEGVRLTDFYVTSPVCTPSRGGLLTGRYDQRYGFENPDLSIAAVMRPGLSQQEAILPQYLKRRGYATACFGKWHLGFAPGSRPTDRGFDEFLGLAGGVNRYFNHYNVGNLDMFLGHNPRVPKPGGEYTSDLFADAAIDFIERRKGAPFFVYLPFTAPHWAASTNPPQVSQPPQAPQAFLDLYPGESAARKGCLASITAMDAAIGRILDRLDEPIRKGDLELIGDNALNPEISGVAMWKPVFVRVEVIDLTPYARTVRFDPATGSGVRDDLVTAAATASVATEDGPGAGGVEFRREGVGAGALHIEFFLAGSAQASLDFADPGTATSMAAGISTAGITLTPIPNDNVDGTRTAQINVLDGAGYYAGIPDGATILIQDKAFDQWRGQKFSYTGPPPAGTGFNDDPDNDSYLNGVEFALRGDPLSPDGPLSEAGTSEAGHLTLTYKRPQNLGELTIIHQISSDLALTSMNGTARKWRAQQH